uniref:Uncharacterized protein n=1 Tax=Anguilla anguilla TaxID=7936 RepID=A0A0E9WKJ7_ANGAN
MPINIVFPQPLMNIRKSEGTSVGFKNKQPKTNKKNKPNKKTKKKFLPVGNA